MINEATAPIIHFLPIFVQRFSSISAITNESHVCETNKVMSQIGLLLGGEAYKHEFKLCSNWNNPEGVDKWCTNL